VCFGGRNGWEKKGSDRKTVSFLCLSGCVKKLEIKIQKNQTEKLVH